MATAFGATPHSRQKSPPANLEAGSCCATQPAKAARTPVASRSGALAYAARYQPVLAIAGASLLGGYALTASAPDPTHFMHGAMGLFLFQLALLKLVDIGGFAAAFAKYDIAAKAWRPYGYIYPFTELALGLLYLSGQWTTATYMATILIMGLGSIGVMQSLMRGDKVKCACVGSKIDVPLGAISVLENVGMAAMAALMLAL